jgi:DNA polymerase III epsilon subunit-like protein
METFYACDTETSGEDPSIAGIVELASVPVTTDGKVVLSKGLQSYVNPGHKIPADAMGVHHITDQAVAAAPRLGTAMRKFKHLAQPKTMIVCHNMDFDKRFLGPVVAKDAELICSMRLARHLYPESPNHKIQTLRYWLDVSPPKSALKGMAPHGALYDSIVLAFVWARMVRDHGADTLRRLNAEPILLQTCHLKAHKGKPWENVPRGYLHWILSADFDRDVVHTARHHLGLAPLPIQT